MIHSQTVTIHREWTRRKVTYREYFIPTCDHRIVSIHLGKFEKEMALQRDALQNGNA